MAQLSAQDMPRRPRRIPALATASSNQVSGFRFGFTTS